MATKLATRWRRDELEQEHQAKVRIAAPEQTPENGQALADRSYEQTKGGDRHELRGLPLFPNDNRGLPGAIAETTPGSDGHLAELDRRLHPSDRTR